MISILMTGRLVANSMNALVLPIAKSGEVSEIRFVSDVPGPPMPNVVYECPPKWLQKTLGRFISKFILLLILGLQKKPDLIYAFNMFPHGISAFFLSVVLRTKCCISVIGGKEAIIDGGYQGDNWVLRLGGIRKPWLEKLFLSILRRTDIVTVMGGNTHAYLTSKRVPYVVVLPLFIDSERFHPADEARDIDVISASSLIPRKRIDLLLKAAEKVELDDLTVHILGTGDLEGELKDLSRSLKIENNIHFIGFSEDFEHDLQRSKLFFMASNTEGLSIAMLMAMACGTVPLVRDVGDLSQAAHHSENALVLPTDSSDAFAKAIEFVLGNEERWRMLSQNGIEYIQEHYSISQSCHEWNETFVFHFKSGSGKNLKKEAS